LRIAQEGVTNALRHAEAPWAVVHVAQEAGHLVVAVDDDGRSGKAPARSDLGGWSVRATLPCHRTGRP
jgi:signal transduction histidine kinase